MMDDPTGTLDAWGYPPNGNDTESLSSQVPDVFAPELYPPAVLELPAADRTKGGPSQSTELVQLALSRYRMVQGDDSKVYAVANDRPGLAISLRGDGGIRQQMSSLFYELRERVPSGSALTDMLTTLEGEARKSIQVHVSIRVGQLGSTIYIDLGTPDGRAVAVTPNGWSVVGASGVLFRRSKATLPMPEPLPGGSLAPLSEMLNASTPNFRLMVGWAVAALIPNIPHPILSITGQQGTAKTTAASTLLSFIDPSPASMQTQPRGEEDWAVSAFNVYGIGLDNVSHMPPWFQDALCKAVTGSALVRRERYSDDGISVLYFRRPIVITSIDPGAIQGDVADRILPVELEPIDRSQRRTDAEVSAAVDSIRPTTLGALLDLLVGVLRELPTIDLLEKPRMADFAEVLAALDKVTGWSTLPDYLAAAEETAHNVLEGDSFAAALVELVIGRGVWEGTSSELLAELGGERPPRNWPTNPRGVSGKLKRLTPALAQSGITVEDLPRQGTRRPHRITSATGARALPALPVCAVCATPLHPALVKQGARMHPSCDIQLEEAF